MALVAAAVAPSKSFATLFQALDTLCMLATVDQNVASLVTLGAHRAVAAALAVSKADTHRLELMRVCSRNARSRLTLS